MNQEKNKEEESVRSVSPLQTKHEDQYWTAKQEQNTILLLGKPPLKKQITMKTDSRTTKNAADEKKNRAHLFQAQACFNAKSAIRDENIFAIADNFTSTVTQTIETQPQRQQ